MDKSIALVTGASGYLGSWVAREFLSEGWRVIGSVRSVKNEEKVAHLKEMQETYPDHLELIEGDLLEPGAFEEACARAAVVVHTASPFAIGRVDDPENSLLRPALEGTRNVLASARRSSTVKRVVLTSSVVATHGDASEVAETEHGFIHEGHWNRTSSLTHQPYSYAKSEAEKAAWEIADKAPWKLVTLNPGFILGPSLSKRGDSASATLLRRLLSGEFASGVPKLSFGVVDVREVARAHLEAASRKDAEGRTILVATHATLLEMAEIIDLLFPGVHPVPRRELPTPLLYLPAPKLGLSWRYIHRNVGKPVRYDNRKSKEILGIFYRSLEETLGDHRNQMVADGLLTGTGD